MPIMKAENLKVLIVDDESELRKTVTSILESMDDFTFSIEEAEDGQEAVQKVIQHKPDLVLMDVRMPNMTGLEALEAIKRSQPKTFVVLMTAHSNLNDAVAAIKEGAYDYLEKPVQPHKLTEIVKKSLEAREIVSEIAISNPIFDDDVDSDFVGSTEKMKEIFDLIYKLCKVDTSVLVRGENGTGKELVASAIHYNSPRKKGEFVAINCGAIPDNLMESELFGHEKGAFTGAAQRKIGLFQQANNGTLFLDEIGELKPDMQVKLLRVLQEKKFTPVGSTREVKTNSRIIAATNRNLEKMIEDGSFREDLFYRLNVMPIFLPPLRERVNDIPHLIQHFIKKFNEEQSKNITDISDEALEILKTYRWPGNIRELENVIERAFILESSPTISSSSLAENLKPSPEKNSSPPPPSTPRTSPDEFGELDFDKFKEQSEKDFIEAALKANKGRINKTVAHANIPKNTLLRKIKKYGINVKDFT